MKHFLISLVVLLAALSILGSCEKDDICPPEASTTPYLKVGFYDIQQQDELKSVPRLRAVGIGNPNPVTTFSDRSSQQEIDLPLKNYENSTSFYLIRDSADDSQGVETGNTDVLQIDYLPEETFISRGCGYSVTYTINQASHNPQGSDPEPWIVAVSVEKASVKPQDTLHVKIYH